MSWNQTFTKHKDLDLVENQIVMSRRLGPSISKTVGYVVSPGRQ